MQHRWKFRRAGGTDQVVIASGADIVNLDQLDQKLWVALACPTRGIEFDPRTLDLLDTDGDGRIRAPELIEAGHWVRDRFADPDELLGGGEAVRLSSINRATDAGRRLAADAVEMLQLLGKSKAESISLADVSDRGRLFAAMRFNGDGIVPAEEADDERIGRLIGRIVETYGGVVDRNGKAGVDQSQLDAFRADAEALDAWRRAGEADEAKRPLGNRTPAAAAALDAVRVKVDDFYARCRLAAYDPAAVDALNPSLDAYRALSAQTLHTRSESVADLPLATVAPGRKLPLFERLNPAWADRVAAFRAAAVEPLLGRATTELDEADWQQLQSRLAECGAWLAAKPASRLEAIDAAELRELLAGDSFDRIAALIAQDAEREPMNARIADIEKMIRLQRDFARLLNNFVSFAEFYDRRGGVFEAGTLYLDGRSCDLTVAVSDVGRHAALAGLAKAYLAYCDCTRPGETMTIVSAFTAGDVDFLMVGRNGVFYDRRGRDWDATIVRVIENPVSIRQAFFLPYKKFLRAIEEQIAKRAAAGEAKAHDELLAQAVRLTAADAPADPRAPAAKAPVTRRIDVGTVAALGVALGSISTVLVGVFAKFVELGWWIPVALAGIVLAISGPSMMIAWLKLRQRSLGPILDASGWAINGQMKINVPLGASLSKTARLPRLAGRSLRDPFAQSHAAAWFALLLVVAAASLYAAWRLTLLDGWLPPPLQCAPSIDRRA